MAIFRGTGGAGDASSNVSINQVTEKALEAEASATAAASSASSAASSASSASTSATNAATSATSASTSATASANSATSASNYKTDAQKLAINAEDSQYTLSDGTTTGYSALHYSEKASDSATSASTSATSASTSATNASGSATTASNAKSDAQKLATTAENTQYTLSDGTTTGYSALHYAAKSASSASAASTSESNASTSASNASNSASDASKLATTAYNTEYTLANGTTTGYSALHYATVAQNAVESIQATYLGPQASNPTLDLNGDAVTAGDWYFNTTDNTTRIYDGTNWNTINPDLVGDTTPQLGGTLDANGNDIDMGTNTITDTKVGQWDTAYGWGDHSTAGYLTSVTGFVSETSSTGSAELPVGTTAQRDASPSAGLLRFNSTESQFEGYDGTAWGAVGGGNTAVVGWENQVTISEDYTITTGNNMMSAGPVTIDTGFTVTVPTGSRWVVV